MLKIREGERQPLERPFTSTNAQTEGARLSSDCLLRLCPLTAGMILGGQLSPPNLRLTQLPYPPVLYSSPHPAISLLSPPP